jgi:alpha-amylase/alpha-mannosidase (GH57 family)
LIGVNFLWHMHQPDYRPAGSAQALLPWVRLHAVRGYTDLLAVLERWPQAHCVVNFSGILLEQLLQSGSERRDYFAELTLRPAADLTNEEAGFIVEHFFSANVQTLIRPFPRYRELHLKRERLLGARSFEAIGREFNNAELTDLLVWFNLAWIGFTGRRDPDVAALLAKGRDFSHADQQAVLAVHERMQAAVLPRYRALADSGTVELSFTPYHHPILPLLIDCSGLGHARPDDPLPDFQWPADATEQVQRGIDLYTQAFGQPPRGAWPAEGSVSDAALVVLADAGVRWAATDQQNLPVDGLGHLTPWHWLQDGRELLLVFRDTRLADNVGFEYASWKAQTAANHLADNILALGQQAPYDNPIVSVILDGENPWEAYPDGGEGFLVALFERLTQDAELRCVTPGMLLDEDHHFPTLEHVDPGSWIMGNFDIWTKDREARQAWRLLARARIELADQAAGPVLDALLAAEGSDWFWWYGETFQSDQKPQFDALFRGHLIAAYAAAGLDAPAEMYEPILDAAAGEARPTDVSSLIEPVIDGYDSGFFEWRGAVEVEAGTGQGAMAASAATGIESLRYGFSLDNFYLRLALSRELHGELVGEGARLRLCVAHNGNEQCLSFGAAPGRRHSSSGRIAVRDVLELEVPLAQLKLERGQSAWFWLELVIAGGARRFPPAGRVPFTVIAPDFDLRNWIV